MSGRIKQVIRKLNENFEKFGNKAPKFTKMVKDPEKRENIQFVWKLANSAILLILIFVTVEMNERNQLCTFAIQSYDVAWKISENVCPLECCGYYTSVCTRENLTRDFLLNSTKRLFAIANSTSFDTVEHFTNPINYSLFCNYTFHLGNA